MKQPQTTQEAIDNLRESILKFAYVFGKETKLLKLIDKIPFLERRDWVKRQEKLNGIDKMPDLSE